MNEPDVIEQDAGVQPEAPATEPVQEPAAAEPKTIAAGAEPSEEKAPEPYWKDDWREKLAEHAAAGDKKIYDKELKRLQRFTDPSAIYGNYRELDNRLNGGGLVKVPDKDASEEDIKNFHKALGVPEKDTDYIDNLTLPDGVTLGDQDKAIASDFAKTMHAAGMTQQQMDQTMAWYFKNEEARAAHIDTLDEQSKVENTRALKEEFGPAFNRSINAIPTLFATAPGGADLNNENSLMNRLLGGRMADGTIIGNDIEMTKFLVSLAKEVNPVATVVENADGSGKSIDDELKEIRNLRKSDRRAYNADTNMQARERELLAAQEKQRARA